MKILLFTYGDPTKKITWSNVPYCLCKALEINSHKVLKFNIGYNAKFQVILNYLKKNKLFLRLSRGLFHDGLISPIWVKYIDFRINRIVKSHKDADLCMFTSFAFFNSQNKIPSLLFHDWSWETAFKMFNVKPNFWERKFIKLQKQAMRKADYVYTLFPNMVDELDCQIGQKKVKWNGIAPVNLLDNKPLDRKKILKNKLNSNIILFIGKSKYIQGLKVLLQAFTLLKIEFKNIELHIVGIRKEEINININQKDIKFYGFLNKDIPEQSELFYDLLRSAAILCNPSLNWAGYSSIVEAMYYYTPIVIIPFSAFTMQFGNSINFGKYIQDSDPFSVKEGLKALLSAPADKRIDYCVNAHEAVKDHTWEIYTKKLLQNLCILDL